MSIRAFEEAINRAEVTGKVARETAEASLRAFEEAIGKVEAIGDEAEEATEAIGKPDVEVAETSARASDEAEGKAKEKRKAGEIKGKRKIEARLESLAKMYETKKAKQDEEETE